MTVITQSDFQRQLNHHLNQLQATDDTLYIDRPHQPAVAVVSAGKLVLLEQLARADSGSLAYAVARDQLIRRGGLPDDSVEISDDNYWGQFKYGSRE